MLKKLFSHTAIYGLSPQIPKIAGFFSLPIITAHLTELDFGVFGLITAVVAGVSVLSNLGLNVVLSNTFVKSPNQYKWAWRQIYGFLIIWYFIYAILLGYIIYFFIPNEVVDNARWIILLNVAPVILFGPTAILGQYYYQLGQKPFQIAIRSVIIGLLAVILNIYFIAGLNLGYMGWFISGAISQFLLQASYWIPVNFMLGLTPIFNFKWKFIKRQLRVTLPTVPHYYGAYLMNMSDRLVMKLVGVPTTQIGVYNAANTVSNVFHLIGNASGQAVGPLLLKTYKDNEEEVAKKLIFTLQIVFLVGTFICSIWLKELFYFLIRNDSLSKAYPLGIILIMAYNYRPMYLGANNRLFYYEKTRVLLKVTFVAGISNLALNFVLIPVFGYQVSAYTTFLGLMYMGYSGFYLKEFKETCSVDYYPMRWLLVTLILTCSAYFLVEMDFIFKVLISIIATCIGLIGIKKIKENES